MSLPQLLRRWQLKAAIQGGLSLLPNPQRWNQWFQAHVTGNLRIHEAFIERKWDVVRRHQDHHERVGAVAWHDVTVLELGTGWMPIVPIGLFLVGAGRVVTVDREDLLAAPLVTTLMLRIAAMARAGRLGVIEPARLRALEAAAAAKASTGTELLARLPIEHRVADARATGLPADSIDMFVSCNTFEHIPREALAAILREFRRVARARAVMSHLIDLADHYATFDPRISVYNFLRYSERSWRWFNNDLQYQNRLRVNDYRALHDASGWSIALQDDTLGAPEELRRLVLAEPFASYDERDLLPYQSWMVSTPAPR